jgi:hypothetical protein
MMAVPPAEVKKHWTGMREALKALTKHGTDGWVVEDIYAFLVSGHATLYVEEGVEGFAIVQLLPNYFGKRLHLWIVHLDDDPLKFMDDILKLAKEHGADRVTFESPRKGWTRRAERLGFQAMRTVYERMV